MRLNGRSTLSTARIALLNRSKEKLASYEAFEYIVDFAESSLDPQSNKVPMATWRFCVTHATPDELLNIGRRAFSQGESRPAELALRFAIESRSWYVMPQAQFVLGTLLEDRDDIAGARNFYARAAKSTYPPYSAAAALSLGTMLLDQRELTEAEEWLTEAAESADKGIKAMALFQLGSLSERRGRPSDAIRFYEEAQTTDPEIAQLAAMQIGFISAMTGDNVTAERYLRSVINIGPESNFETYEMALWQLAGVLQSQDDFEGAERCLREILESGRCSQEGRALAEPALANLMRSQGRDSEADEIEGLSTEGRQYTDQLVSLLGGTRFMQQVEHEAQLEGSFWAESAIAFLLQRVEQTKDVELARRLVRMASEQQNFVAYARSSIALGTILLEQGNHEEAIPLLSNIANGDIAYEAAKASLILGLFYIDERPDSGVEALVRAYDGEDDNCASMAAAELGRYYMEHDDNESALLWLQRGVERGSPELRATGAIYLGEVYYARGEREAAGTAWEMAIALGNHETKAQARWALGVAHYRIGELAEAELQWSALLELGLNQWKTLAAQGLSEIWERSGQYERAAALLTGLSADRSDPEAALAVLLLLARLLCKHGNFLEALQKLAEALGGFDLKGQCILRCEIAEIQISLDDQPGACDNLRTVLQAGLPQFVGRAVIRLIEIDPSADAEALLRLTMEAEDDPYKLEACLRLGRLLKERSQADEAQRLFERVLESENPDMRPHAMLELGLLSEDQQAAEQYLLAAVEEQHVSASPRAAAALGARLLDLDRKNEALELFLVALNYEDSLVTNYCRTCAAALLFEFEERDRAWELWRYVDKDDVPSVAYIRAAAAMSADIPEEERAEARQRLIAAAEMITVTTLRADIFSITMGLLAVGEPSHARQMLQRLLSDDDASSDALIRSMLAVVLEDEGDTEAAQETYSAAISLEQFGSGAAAISLGAMFERQGDLDRAREAYEVAQSLGGDEGSMALVSLGKVREQLGDRDGAQEAYRRALESDLPIVVAEAAGRLALLIEEEGEPGSARELWKKVATYGSSEKAEFATFKIAQQYFHDEDYASAGEWFLRVVNSPSVIGQMAAYMLANLRSEFGADWSEVRDLLMKALHGPDSETAARAGLLLFRPLYKDGDSEGAIQALNVVLSCSDESYKSEALLNLGMIYAAGGKAGEAIQRFELAARLGTSPWASTALLNLGILCEQQNDLPGAISALKRAVEMQDPATLLDASSQLATLYEAAGDLQSAEQELRMIVNSRHPEASAGAAVRLGRLLFARGDLEGARSLWLQAAESDDADSAALARESLGLLIEE